MEEIKENENSNQQSGLSTEFQSIDETAQAMEKENLAAKNQELEDTKAYLEVVMQELEDTRRELALLKRQKSREKPSKNWWKFLSGAEAVVLAVLLVVFGILYVTESLRTKDVSNQDKTVIVNDDKNHEKKGKSNETTKLVSDLSAYIANMETSKIEPFSASVEDLFGYEYLCFSYQQLKIYYRNEFDTEDTKKRFKIMIDNGNRLAEFNWDYDFDNSASLVPYYGTYTDEGTNQLMFLQYEEKFSANISNEEESSINIPKEVRMVEVSSLFEYDMFQPLQELDHLFEYAYHEAVPENGGAGKTRMTLTINSANYTYAIPQDIYTDAVYNGESGLKFRDYFELEITDKTAVIKTVVYLSDQEYLGELTANIAVNDGKVGFSGVKYGAYVLPDQEDYGSDGVIIPRTSVMDKRVTILGNNKERYLIELSDKIELCKHDWNNFIKEENGLKAYYQDGQKQSIAGIDVSKYQGDIDWQKVKSAGIEFAIVRLGFRGYNEGTLELDPYFEQNMQRASEAGMPLGVYFFSQAITEEEAREEARMVLENIKEYPVTYPVIFDTEVILNKDARANNLTRQERTNIAKAFMDEVAAAGYEPMIYANTKWMIMALDLEQLTQYDKWYAYYGDTVTFPYEFQMLQYSDTGKIPGIQGNVDLNISFIDYANTMQRE